MGIFGNRKILSASDAEIIMIAMILSVAADGTIEEKETKTILGLAAQFPAFNGKDLGTLFSKGCNAISKNGFEGAIKNIASASTEVKGKAFIAKRRRREQIALSQTLNPIKDAGGIDPL